MVCHPRRDRRHHNPAEPVALRHLVAAREEVGDAERHQRLRVFEPEFGGDARAQRKAERRRQRLAEKVERQDGIVRRCLVTVDLTERAEPAAILAAQHAPAGPAAETR